VAPAAPSTSLRVVVLVRVVDDEEALAPHLHLHGLPLCLGQLPLLLISFVVVTLGMVP
jgi:hypothetical protein